MMKTETILKPTAENHSRDGINPPLHLTQEKMQTPIEQSSKLPKAQLVRMQEAHKEACMVWVEMAQRLEINWGMVEGWLNERETVSE